MKRLRQKFSGLSVGIKFLNTVILIYFILLVSNFTLFVASLDKFIILIIKILPSILGAFVLIFIFNFVLSDKKIKKYLTGELNWQKYFLTISLGILSSGPIYAWYPFLADLREQGFKNSLITIFLYNRAIKLPFITVLIYYFSLKFVILTIVLMVIFSIINGMIMDKIIKN